MLSRHSGYADISTHLSAALRGSIVAIVGGCERMVVEKTPPSRTIPRPFTSANSITSVVSMWHTWLLAVRTDVAVETTDTEIRLTDIL